MSIFTVHLLISVFLNKSEKEHPLPKLISHLFSFYGSGHLIFSAVFLWVLFSYLLIRMCITINGFFSVFCCKRLPFDFFGGCFWLIFMKLHLSIFSFVSHYPSISQSFVALPSADGKFSLIHTTVSDLFSLLNASVFMTLPDYFYYCDCFFFFY